MLRGPTRYHQRRGQKIVTAPATEPVTADDLRAYVVADAVQLPDAEAASLIATARQFIEDRTGVAMVTQEWSVALDRWPTGREPWWDGVRQGALSELAGPVRVYDLPRYPLISVDAVSTYDEAGNATAVTVAATFDVDTYSTPGRMALKAGATWPIALRDTNAILITYTAGYGDASDVPAPLARAVLVMAGYMFEHRGGCDSGDAYVKSGSQALAGAYEVVSL